MILSKSANVLCSVVLAVVVVEKYILQNISFVDGWLVDPRVTNFFSCSFVWNERSHNYLAFNNVIFHVVFGIFLSSQANDGDVWTML